MTIAANAGGAVGKKRHSAELDKYDLAILSALSLNTRLTTVDLAQRVLDLLAVENVRHRPTRVAARGRACARSAARPDTRDGR